MGFEDYTRFSGKQPVSVEGRFGSRNYRLLMEKDYLVSWKPAGNR